MDSNIRTLLAASQKSGPTEGRDNLQKAYEILRNVAEVRPAVDTPESFGQDLYVLCSEIAFQQGQIDITRECLKMYFMRTPPANQFLCRAYLCQAQLLAPQSADLPEQLEKAVVYLLKAISMAKENVRYHFLVYNASVLYWQFSRPFLKPGYRHFLAQSLHQVVKALDDVNDRDHEWRAHLMIALVECHMDAGHKTDASHIATAAAAFVREHVPSLYKNIFGLMISFQLVDSTNPKIQSELRHSTELNVFYRIRKLKLSIEERLEKIDVAEELKKIYALASERPPRSTRGSSIAEAEDEVQKMLPLLLELGRLASEHHFPDIALQCVDHIQDNIHVAKDQGFLLEVEFLQCELMVKSLLDKQYSYQKQYVDIRLQAVKRCHEAIQNAKRSSSPNTMQAGCVTQWNLCLPLLQRNLRSHVRKPLTLVAEVLEDIQSLLNQLRCQVHTELAKCEEDVEQIEVAIQHLKKALMLDDGRVYQERVQIALHRLELRAELYKQPERPEDQAAMIIEQARKANSGTVRMKRSLLVKAGQALAPDAFLLVLDSENDTKEVSSGPGPLTQVKRLAGKARQFKSCVKKAEGHLRRLGRENDRERAQLWCDLAKTARKQEVWDVCRVASRFCLLYDDRRWKNEVSEQEGLKQSRNKSLERDFGNADGNEPERSTTELTKSLSLISGKDAGSRSQTPEEKAPLYEKDLIRMIAEVHFVNGEALVHLLRTEGVELGDLPLPPVDRSKRPKGYVTKKPEEDPDWIEYVEWITSIKTAAVDSFLRAVSLGTELMEPWIVCSSASYCWNYINHILVQNRHREVIAMLESILAGLKQVGHAGETVLLVDVCNALALGLLQPWIPKPAQSEDSTSGGTKSPTGGSSLPVREKSPKRGGKSRTSTKGQTGSMLNVIISGDSTADLKKAVEVCESAMKTTNGDNPSDVVPISVRLPLLQTWVKAKQMLQSQIGRGLGIQEESDDKGQNFETRAMVAVEMLQLNRNGIMEFKDTPTLKQAVELVENTTWSDKLIELQMWTRLAYLAHEAGDHKMLGHSAEKAISFAEASPKSRSKRQDHHKYVVEQELLSFASSLYGQGLAENIQGKNSIRRKAMEQFLCSAQFACEAQNSELVMLAARHYWNACLPLINQPIERELLRQPLTALLQCISDTTDKSLYKRASEDDEDDYQKEGTKGVLPHAPNLLSTQPASGETGGAAVKPASKSAAIGGPEDDLTLRASLYGVLFQSYADKGQWEAGLQAMDKAIADMPRTNHRLLIFKHLIIVKAKLGQNVSMSIQKFRDESEDYVAHMWRRVALCSTQKLEQLQAYQNAIEALNNPFNQWQKVDYLLEFAQWLYCNEFHLGSVVDTLEWAADILLNMTFEEAPRLELKVKKMKSQRKTKSPPPSAKKSSKMKSTADSKKSKENTSKKATELAEATLSTSQAVSEVDPEGTDYLVPAEKVVAIGCASNNPSLTVQELSDIQQLEGLFRIQVLLAQVCGRSSSCYANYCIMAYTCIMRMWQVSLGNAGPVIKELAKNPPPEPPRKGSPTKGKDKKEPMKEKPKRKGAPDAVPASAEEWAAYDAPGEVLEAFKQEAMKANGINASTITKPSLTVLYLDLLCKQLDELGYHSLMLPVLAMADVISRGLLDSRLLTAHNHQKSMEVCISLDLQHGANFHEELADRGLNKEEQAKSHEEILLWREKQTQVAKEESRLKKSVGSLQTSTSMASQQDREMNEKLLRDDEVASHLGPQIGSVRFRDVWTESAELLLRNAMYQPAREMLNEAYRAAEAFDDMPLLARVLYLLGRLSFQEAQYGQAISFVTKAQNTYNGDEMFWYETITLMVDATLLDYEVKERDRNRKARGILVDALCVLREVFNERPNKQSVNGFILASLEAKLGSVQALIATCEHDDILQPKVTEALLAACKKMETASDSLVRLGYRREAMGVFKEQAGIYSRLARKTTVTSDKHAYYIQSLGALEAACEGARLTWHDVQSLAPMQEMKKISYPVQRELAEMSLLCAEMMLEMLQVYIGEVREEKVQNQRKGSVLRAVEELVRETPNYTSVEERWMKYTDTMGDCALALLATAHSLGLSTPRLKSKALYNTGKCIRLLGEHKGPDSAGEWNVEAMDVIRVTQSIVKEVDAQSVLSEDGEQLESNKNTVDTTSPEYIKYAKAFTKLRGELDTSHRYMAQATECLVQAVNFSLQKGMTDTAGLAALELVDSLGQFDAALASQYLAIYQSCQASAYLKAILKMSLADPSLSRQAALLCQLQQLHTGSISSNAEAGPVMRGIIRTLQESSLAWKRLEVMPHHLDLTKEFPANMVFVILQHSPDKSHLYGAVLDKPKSGSGSKSTKNVSLQGTSHAKVVKTKTSASELEELISRYRWYKHETMQVLQKMEYQSSIVAQRDKMLASLTGGAEVKQEDSRASLEKEFAEDRKRLNAKFEKLLSDMEMYLQPITSLLDSAFRPRSSTTVSNQREGKKEEPSHDYVVLLADQWLLELPLEALQVLQAESIVSVTRDISIQMLYHKKNAVEVAEGSDDKAKEKEKTKGKNALPSRIPGLREAGKKQCKIIALDRVVPHHCLPVDTHGFRYIVDPYLDCSETEQHKPIDKFNALLEEHSQQFTPRWLGVSGDDHRSSTGEFEIYLSEGSAFVFYGMERFLCNLPPHKVAAMNLPECQIVMLYDLAQTASSSLRQSKTDVLKTANVLLLEKSVESAMLLSLAGVRCVVLNQWHCTLQENAEKLHLTMKDLLTQGKTTGETVRLLVTPFRRKQDEEGEAGEAIGQGQNAEVSDTEVSQNVEHLGYVEQAEETTVNQSWYNMVCYGLPNLMVTQLSK